MSEEYKNISLEKLKNDIGFSNGQELANYFNNNLSMKDYRNENGYSIIIEFINYLNEKYNECFDKSVNDTITYNQTLLKVFEWFFPLLTPFDKIIVQTNICILTDDEKDTVSNNLFACNLKKANKLIKSTGEKLSHDNNFLKLKLLCESLDVLGYLNIREHNYECAKFCIQLCINLLLDLDINKPNHTDIFYLYIKSIIQLANCYEYTDYPWEAIQCILNLDSEQSDTSKRKWENLIQNNAKKIRSKIIDYYFMPKDNLSSKDDTFDIVKDVVSLLLQKPEKNINFQVFELDKKNEIIPELLKSFIHVLAHCISEYASKIRTTNYEHPLCSTLQMISRFLLDWLVVSCKEDSLVTCQATIRAENDACPEAIKLLINRHSELEINEEKNTIVEQNELQEIEFFLFYFAEQELRYNYNDLDLHEIFNKYDNKFYNSSLKKVKDGDYDPLFHYYVIKFKYLFKQIIDKFIHSSGNGKLDTQEADNVFLSMCNCKDKCSEHIFKGLIIECERLEKLYVMYKQLQWLNEESVNEEKYNLFMQLWSFYNDGEKTTEIKDIVSKIYNEIIQRNKILILAPIKNAPSCSSEYDEVKKLLKLPKYQFNRSKTIECSSFVSARKKIERYCIKTPRYCLNSNNCYKHLKWAIFYPNKDSYIYLYMNTGNEQFYNDVVPIYLDTEKIALNELLKRIEDNIIDEFSLSVSHNKTCPMCDSKDECSSCETFLIMPDTDNNLKQLLFELLTFLEFDFHIASKLDYLKSESILIYYPKQEGASSKNFWALSFDEGFLSNKYENGLCEICRESFVEKLENEVATNDDLKSSYEDEHKCKMFSHDKLIEKRQKVYDYIDNNAELTANDKKNLKEGICRDNETMQNKGFSSLCVELTKCINGECNNLEQVCEVSRLISEYQF